MQSFLEEVVDALSKKYTSMEHLVFVLPSKRAGTFVRNALAQKTTTPSFAPDIFSIEGFVEHLSGVSYATNTEQLFELYNTYSDLNKGEKDSFYVFSKWGQTLLQDFNEIDRYLIDTDQLFSNLSAIQEVSIWSPEAEKTQMMEDYLDFWNKLDPLYHAFNKKLLQQGIGHQGLVYRMACQVLEQYLEDQTETTHIFIGFNALNTAESKIIQRILNTGKAEIYWDIDRSFLEDPVHDAGLFIRQHRRSWPYIKEHDLKGLSNHYNTEKEIEVIGVPKNISQAKYIGGLLKKMYQTHPAGLKNTAVVLGDETLLNPLLHAVPAEIPDVNITMGYPLGKTPLAELFVQYISLYINRDPKGWFYQPILALLTHPYLNTLLTDSETNHAATLSETIKNNNWAYVTPFQLQAVAGHPMIASLFFETQPTPDQFVEKCLELLLALRDTLSAKEDALSMEYVYRFYTLFNQLQELIGQHHFISDLKSLLSLYKELLSSQTLDFQGEPLQGLQIMGMLESRNLDFETVILSSVNEGILPAGKSNNSFIPFDLKKYFNLPTYKEKDAVYTYHFYRLLQRAKKVYLLYNTEPDVLEGGEKSRLIRQLLTDEQVQPFITERIAAPLITPTVKTLEKISKDEGMMQLIQAHAASGFSPTSLSNYIRNPLDFYTRNLLKIDDLLEVEETVAANTFGTIVHDTLEEIYTPFIGLVLQKEMLVEAKKNLQPIVQKHFAKSYLEGDISRGKNLIAFKVVLRYVANFLDLEIREVAQHEIKIIALEQKLKRTISIPQLAFPVYLKGTLDRIDTYDGTTRIIDYKTGKVLSSQVEIVAWDELVTSYEYSKAFQLLCYAFMYDQEHTVSTIEAGIFSFKNLKAGLLAFATKEKRTSRNKTKTIDQETIEHFKEQLIALIMEICNPALPILEKEV